MSEPWVYPPTALKPDPSKPVRIIERKEKGLFLQFYDVEGRLHELPLVLVVFPPEFQELRSQLPLRDFWQTLSIRHAEAAIMVPVDVQGSAVMVPVDIQASAINVPINIVLKQRELVASTTTALAANASWSSGPIDMLNHSKLYVTVFADQAGTLYIDQSPDGSNWDVTESISVSANTGVAVVREIAGRYARVRYVNGATAQTVFRLYVWRAAI
ncbi:MAG: hypothetical protein QW794_01640 [Thermosphaera sp.]